MGRQRDPFGNVERMRRELGDLFDDVWSRTGLTPRHRIGFRPRVDVYYCDQPPRAVVKADLAGVREEDVNLEVHGRRLRISGERRPSDTEGRVYQQIEIEHGPFACEVELEIEVDPEQAAASYSNGILRIELPVVRRRGKTTAVPITSGGRKSGRS
jgi:HSP20 family protein